MVQYGRLGCGSHESRSFSQRLAKLTVVHGFFQGFSKGEILIFHILSKTLAPEKGIRN